MQHKNGQQADKKQEEQQAKQDREEEQEEVQRGRGKRGRNLEAVGHVPLGAVSGGDEEAAVWGPFPVLRPVPVLTRSHLLHLVLVPKINVARQVAEARQGDEAPMRRPDDVVARVVAEGFDGRALVRLRGRRRGRVT